MIKVPELATVYRSGFEIACAEDAGNEIASSSCSFGRVDAVSAFGTSPRALVAAAGYSASSTEMKG